LEIGENIISIGIRAENGAGNTYTLTLTRVNAATHLIESTEDMAKIGVDPAWTLADDYKLMSDIALANWAPIGGDEPFSGIFDGNGHTVTLAGFNDKPVGSILVYSELTTTTPDNPVTCTNVFLGIFGAVQGAAADAPAVVKNLAIAASVDSTVDEIAGTAVGLVAGYGRYAVFDNITLSGTFTFTIRTRVFDVSKPTGYVGGVVGIVRSEGTVIKNCNSSLEIDAELGAGHNLIYGLPNAFSFAGGIVGYMEDKVGIENCHNTGKVRGISSAPFSQLMVGGILGGTHYAFSTTYHGSINRCSSTGDITVGCMHFWPFAGGIAGVIVGGHGTLESSTRITRCFAGGTITVLDRLDLPDSGKSGQWPYIGGIVGYQYYGAWVSQCAFNGTVIVGRLGDYVGGIAGYNSYFADFPVPSGVIEDCWSAGIVQGYNNAGGIVGQQQRNTITRRCYSRAAVSLTNGGSNSLAGYGIGGIAGFNVSITRDSMIGCVALNPSITAPQTTNNYIHRVAGAANPVGYEMVNNYALSTLVPVADDGSYTPDKGRNRPDGADIPASYLEADGKPKQSFYTSLGWDFKNVWKMGNDGYPRLRWQD
jgi:hypothetical protein